MQFSERWLRILVETDQPLAALTHTLTMAGLEVEAVQPVAAAFEGVVVAEILRAERHPDADRLQICSVRVGEAAPLTIVCGAPNARAGLKTACALVGAKLPAAEIRPVQVRGVESHGMLCSAKELGMADASTGILELPADAPVGVSLRDYLHLNDHLITLKLTPNRGDCLSLNGVARELAALLGVQHNAVDCSPVEAMIADVRAVRVEAPQACPIYCGRILRGIDPFAQTPMWMAERLLRSGMRPIHPVVDVTNYVLLELGQPMHAFDLAKLSGPVRVRWARDAERLTLLDGRQIDLAHDCLVIADDNGPLALAGVMGGAASAVGATTSELLLEAAHFTPAAIAGRARRYGLATDSSHRFERGVDPKLPRQAMERATRLILDICGGTAGEIVEVGPGLPPPAAIAFRPERARRLLGVQIDDRAMRKALERLGMQLVSQAQTWQVVPPSWRFDLETEVDLIEEVARLQGYEQIPAATPSASLRLLPVAEGKRTENEIKNIMVSFGYQEVITYSFISQEQHIEFSEDHTQIVLKNPIATHMGVMRASLMPGLVQTLRHNLNHGQERLRIFELGRCFLGVEPALQPVRLAGLAYGTAWPEQWGAQRRWVDFYDLKADVEALFWPVRLQFTTASHPALHPGQSAQVALEGRPVGWLGRLHPRLVQKYGFTHSPVLFELEVAALTLRPLPRYRGLSCFPAVRRDLAVVVDAGLNVGELINAVRDALPATITEFELFDVYQGAGIDTGKKSLAFRMLLQHTEKTLTEPEIEAAVSHVLAFLSERFNAVLRS